MENNLKRLHLLLMQLDPELFIRLQDEGRLESYFDSFHTVPELEAELTVRFESSRYHYIAEVLEEDFLSAYLLFSSFGILPYELINLAEACAGDFDNHLLPEARDNRLLRYAVIATIDEYLKGGPQDGI